MRRGVGVVLWVLLGVLSAAMAWVYIKRAVVIASEKDVVEVEVPVPVVVGVHMVEEKPGEHVSQPIAA